MEYCPKELMIMDYLTTKPLQGHLFPWDLEIGLSLVSHEIFILSESTWTDGRIYC